MFAALFTHVHTQLQKRPSPNTHTTHNTNTHTPNQNKTVCQTYPRSDLVVSSHAEQDLYVESAAPASGKVSTR